MEDLENSNRQKRRAKCKGNGPLHLGLMEEISGELGSGWLDPLCSPLLGSGSGLLIYYLIYSFEDTLAEKYK